jgi:hypothetical protein
VLYGLLSDCVPIRGKRRKPYFVIGWSLFVFCNLFLAGLTRPSLNAIISLVRQRERGRARSPTTCLSLSVYVCVYAK